MSAINITLHQKGDKLIVKQDTKNTKPLNADDLEDNSYFWAAIIGQRVTQINSNRKGIYILVDVDNLQGTNLARAVQKEMAEKGVEFNGENITMEL